MLTQSAANDIIKTPKMKKSDDSYGFPRPGEKLTIPIISQDEQEDFLIDVSRGRGSGLRNAHIRSATSKQSSFSVLIPVTHHITIPIP